MFEAAASELRAQIRGITGALLVVGLPFHYTMETWRLGWTLPLTYLTGFAVVGLTVVVLVTRSVGFHEDNRGTERWRDVGVDFAEVLLQSFVASYVILLLLGILDFGSSVDTFVRLGLVEVVPLGFGAALANRVFRGESEEDEEEGAFPRNTALFSLGALFVASTIALTQEIELIAVHMGWVRHLLLIVLSLVLVYLVLYELEFKGQDARLRRDGYFQIGTTFVVYAVGAVTSFLLLLSFGHFIDATVALMCQETIVLSFPASLGAAAAEVLL